MATKLSMRKEGLYLVPLTQADAEELGHYANGTVVNANLTGKRARSIKFHRLYWSMLRLALDYWTPHGGMLTVEERNFSKGLVEYVESAGFESSAIKSLMKSYMKDLIELRSTQIDVPYKDIKNLHTWIKIEAGYFDYVLTPEGSLKKAKSIAFDSMTNEEFRAFYKRAFTVVWNMILVKSFKSPKEAQEAIDRLNGYGS